MAAMVGRWLVKTEPGEWSWEHQQANGGVSHWDGVRNGQAQKHLRAMAEGDLCFFYHSGPKAKEIVGITRVCKPFYPDPSDASSKHGMVDIEAVSTLAQPLSLARLLKQDDRLHNFILFRQARLSVVPVSISEWDVICELAGQLEPPSSLDNGDVSSKASGKVYDGEATARPLSSDDNGVRMRVKKQVSNGGARSGAHASDDNGNVSMRFNKQDLELCDGETRVSLVHMTEEGKSYFSDDNAGDRVRVFEQVIEPCHNEARVRRSNTADKPSRPHSARIRERGKPPNFKACIDGINVALDAEESKPPNLRHGKTRVSGVEKAPNMVAQNRSDANKVHGQRKFKRAEASTDVDVRGEGDSCDMPATDFTMEVSRTLELASDTKRVYSRRIKKERQLDSLSPDAEVTMVSDPGKVYKRRHRKQRSVESLSR